MLSRPESDTFFFASTAFCTGLDNNEIARFGDPGRLGVSYNRLCDRLPRGLMQIQVIGNSFASIATSSEQHGTHWHCATCTSKSQVSDLAPSKQMLTYDISSRDKMEQYVWTIPLSLSDPTYHKRP